MIKKIARYLLPLLAAAGLLWFVYKDTDLDQMWQTFATVKWGWILLGTIPATISHVSRAVRWKMLLKPAGYNPSLLNTFLALMSGYFANYIVPRLGEVTRCGMLNRSEKIPVATSLGTVVTERAFDLLSLLIIVLITLFIEFEKLSSFLGPLFGSKLQNLPGGWPVLLGSFVLLLIAAIFILYYFQDKIKSLPAYGKVSKLVGSVWVGVSSITRLESPAWFLAHTVIIWTGYFLMSFLPFYALEATAHLGLRAGMTLLVVGSLGMAAPVQGGIGAYHFMVSRGLMLYGVTALGAEAIAAVLHTYQTVYTMGLGGICFVILLIISAKKASDTAKE